MRRLGSRPHIRAIGNDILEHFLNHMVILHDSRLYVGSVLISERGPDVGSRCQHFFCVGKLFDGLIILIGIRIRNPLDGRKHPHRCCVKEFHIGILFVQCLHERLAYLRMFGRLPYHHRGIGGHDTLCPIICMNLGNRIAVHVLEQVR